MEVPGKKKRPKIERIPEEVKPETVVLGFGEA